MALRISESPIRPLPTSSHLALTTGALFVVGYFLWVDAQQKNEATVEGWSSGGSPSAASSVVPVAMARTDMRPGGLPSPKQQGAASKKLVEGHWHGMEVIELTPALAAQYGVASSTTGLLVDEVTLEAAESGVLAGDVLLRLDAMNISTMRDFSEATYLLRDNREVEMGLLRRGRQVSVWLRGGRALGAAMFEAAQPILPGAIAPHQDKKRPCTDCHLIMERFGQLAIDAGDLLPSPKAVTADAIPPHGNRGPCASCHRIVGVSSGSFRKGP